MHTALVGYTGFVGSNLMQQTDFSNIYNSKNIKEAYGTKPDLLIYAGVTGTKFMANSFPEKDKEIIECAKYNIERINAKRTILISTVDIYDNLDGKDENYCCETSRFGTYGNDRLSLETWFINRNEKGNIVRLPAIYGLNLKKNFIFDIIHGVPPILKSDVFEEICSDNKEIKEYFKKSENGYYYLDSKEGKIGYNQIKNYFRNSKYNSIFFTDSRSCYQYYNLSRLWDDIQIILKNDIDIINLVTEPIESAVLYEKVFNKKFVNEISQNYVRYNLKTMYGELFHGSHENSDYIVSKEKQIQDVLKYISSFNNI